MNSDRKPNKTLDVYPQIYLTRILGYSNTSEKGLAQRSKWSRKWLDTSYITKCCWGKCGTAYGMAVPENDRLHERRPVRPGTGVEEWNMHGERHLAVRMSSAETTPTLSCRDIRAVRTARRGVFSTLCRVTSPTGAGLTHWLLQNFPDCAWEEETIFGM